MTQRRVIPVPYKLTKKVARQQLAALLIGTSEKALHGYLTVEQLCRTTGLPEAEVRVKLAEAREARPL